MSEEILEMPFLRNIGLIVTYKCQVACPHCIIEAGPHRTEEMRLEDVHDWIAQIAAYRLGFIKVLSLTGGEPFYDLGKLKAIADDGAARGLLVSAVTNAYWATSREEARRVLQQVASIRMIAVSTDVYHQQAIPFERVQNAILAAQELEMPYNVSVCTDNDQDPAYQQLLARLRAFSSEDLVNTAITFPAGRALQRAGLANYQTTVEPPIAACSAGSAPIVFPDGRIIACIGPIIDLTTPHPLVLGNLRERSLAAILDDAELNPILHAVRLWGPKRLIELLGDQIGDRLPERYIKDSVCHACYSLMSDPVIVAALEELAANFEFRRKVAYARLYYLREPQMLQLMEQRHELTLER